LFLENSPSDWITNQCPERHDGVHHTYSRANLVQFWR
jgi:hypothetical protein